MDFKARSNGNVRKEARHFLISGTKTEWELEALRMDTRICKV